MLDTEIKVTLELAAEHGLTAEEYARIQKILGREPLLLKEWAEIHASELLEIAGS